MEKKPWLEPKLIELVRSSPAETLLEACRIGPPGEVYFPATIGGGCYCPASTACTPCIELVAS
jgi:hypothetical protein